VAPAPQSSRCSILLVLPPSVIDIHVQGVALVADRQFVGILYIVRLPFSGDRLNCRLINRLSGAPSGSLNLALKPGTTRPKRIPALACA
jgi:hypothetical protein